MSPALPSQLNSSQYILGVLLKIKFEKMVDFWKFEHIMEVGTMHKDYKKRKMLGVFAAGAFGLAMILMILGLGGTIDDIHESMVSHEASAILASAGVEDGETVALPVTYYDQQAEECVNLYDNANDKLAERQFEWRECGYLGGKLEQGLVDFYLGEDYLPVATGAGVALTNRGISAESFRRWFAAVDGASVSYPGILEMKYDAATSEFEFYQAEFYPLDSATSRQADGANRDGHNHLFTMSLAVPFTVLADGGETFEIEADDDTFVFVGDRLALDLGGVHDAMTAKFVISEEGKVLTAVNGQDLAYSGVQLGAGETTVLRIFHADRNSTNSVLNMQFTRMNLAVESVNLARSGEEAVQIAYDPTDPTYVAPLGETSIVKPDGTRGYVIMATILGVAIIPCAMFTAFFAHILIKGRK